MRDKACLAPRSSPGVRSKHLRLPGLLPPALCEKCCNARRCPEMPGRAKGGPRGRIWVLSEIALLTTLEGPRRTLQRSKTMETSERPRPVEKHHCQN